MFKGTRILIWSENPDKLIEFYRDILKLELEDKTDIPEKDGITADYGYMFFINEAKTDKVWIGKHSDVKGYSKEPLRIMHNLYTDEVQKWYEKIKAASETAEYSTVKIISKPEKTPFYSEELPWYVSTFSDPEGNTWQFMGKL